MARRKNVKKVEEKDEVVEDIKSDYNYHDDLKSRKEIPVYMRKGFEDYITDNKLQIRNETDLTKTYEKFLKSNSGA